MPSRRKQVLALMGLVSTLFLASGAGAQDAADSAGSPAAQPFRQQLRNLHWMVGPQRVQLFGNSSLQVPEGYAFLGTQDTAKFETLEKQLPGGPQYLFIPKDFRWQVLFEYQDDGYVKDNESIDPNAILNNIREGTEKANEARRERGYDEMEVTGWQTAPHYDSQTHRLEWAVRGRDRRTGEEVVNFNTRILGRGGVMSVILIAAPEQLTASISDLKAALNGFAYESGQRYAEYKPGDKIAKYGLAALITGGAAAVAVKTGFWKVIVGVLVAGWKVVAAAAVALFGAVTRFFKRKTD